MPPIDLWTAQLHVTVDPDRGAGLLGLRVRRGERWMSLMPEPATSDLAASSFLMVPYSNRVANGRFTFGGQAYQLANAENYAIHGDVRKRPWAVVAQASSSTRLAFQSREHPGVNWPWAFSCSVTFTLLGNRLHSQLSVRNESDSPMPAGLGFHPYFLRALSRAGEPIFVQFSVKGVYPDALGTRIPSGPAVHPTPAQDFSAPRPLDAACFHDFCAHGYEGGGSIHWPESGVKLSFDESATLDHLVFFNPPKPYFAMEPVSNANDGFNLHARGDATSGVRVLLPGDDLVADWGLTVDVTD